MASPNEVNDGNEVLNNKPLINLPPIVQKRLVDYVNAIVAAQSRFESFKDRLEEIDYNYYLFKKNQKKFVDGKDQPLSDSEVEDIIETPIATSQVDSIVAYLTSLYLSGYPIFGVVTPKEFQDAGEMLEAMIDNHAIRGRWGRELILTFKDAAKYNITGIGNEWAPISTLSVSTNPTTTSRIPKLEIKKDYINKLKNLDLYNAFWDYTKPPALVSEFGEYIGFHELIRKTELKMDLIIAAQAGEAYNIKEAMESALASRSDCSWYTERPIVNNLIDIPNPETVNWVSYAHNMVPRSATMKMNYSGLYLKTVAYIRIIPTEFGLFVPSPNTPQIYKVTVINQRHLVGLRRINTPFNMLPIMLGQLTEDGFGYQTKSVVENAMPWQDATTELLNIRLNSARRALSDRAVYNPDVLSPYDVNTRSPAAKIPMRAGLRGELADAGRAYAAIPFDDSGTAGTITDMNALLNLNEYLYGINSARQGVFKKGNRTLGEYSDVQSSSDDRSRVMALQLESQLFIPIKFHIKSNILLYAEPEKLVRQSSGTLVDVDIDKIRAAILDFKVSDGLTPKSKILSPDLLMSFIQFIQSDPGLYQRYDTVKAVSHVMSLYGISNLEQYARSPDEQQQMMRQAAQQAQAEQAPSQPVTQPGIQS